MQYLNIKTARMSLFLSNSLPSGAEGLVGCVCDKRDGFPSWEHLTGHIQVGAVCTVGAWVAQHGVFQQVCVAGPLTLTLQGPTERQTTNSMRD